MYDLFQWRTLWLPWCQEKWNPPVHKQRSLIMFGRLIGEGSWLRSWRWRKPKGCRIENNGFSEDKKNLRLWTDNYDPSHCIWAMQWLFSNFRFISHRAKYLSMKHSYDHWSGAWVWLAIFLELCRKASCERDGGGGGRSRGYISMMGDPNRCRQRPKIMAVNVASGSHGKWRAEVPYQAPCLSVAADWSLPTRSPNWYQKPILPTKELFKALLLYANCLQATAIY